MNVKDKIRSISSDTLLGIAKASVTVMNAMELAGIEYSWSNFKAFQERLKEENLLEIIYKNYKKEKRRRDKYRKIIGGYTSNLPTKIFVKNSPIKLRRDLLKKILRLNILPNECSECGLGPSYNGKPLEMIPDNINGVRRDNRIENLRLLCPNCCYQMKKRRRIW